MERIAKETTAARRASRGRNAKRTVANQLRGLGMKGVLVKMAERGQILELECEMPQCYHPQGRRRVRSGLHAAHEVGTVA